MKHSFLISAIVLTALTATVILIFTPFAAGNPKTFDQSVEQKSDKMIKTDPESFLTKPGDTCRLHVTGGLPQYRWYTISGDIQELSKNIFLYTSPQRYGSDTITFEDRAGQKAVVTVEIIRPLTISPGTTSMRVKERAVFSISGGSGKWEVIQHNGFKILDKKEKTMTIEALKCTGEKTIVIQDKKTGEIKKNHIIVYDTLKIDMNSS